MRQVWAELHGEILEVVDSGEVVVSVIRWHLRGRSYDLSARVGALGAALRLAA